MLLAIVTGRIVATQKTDELRGSNLLLVTALGDDLEPIKDRTYVAVDCVGAGIHDQVLVEEYFALHKQQYKAMSIIAIVEKILQEQ